MFLTGKQADDSKEETPRDGGSGVSFVTLLLTTYVCVFCFLESRLGRRLFFIFGLKSRFKHPRREFKQNSPGPPA